MVRNTFQTIWLLSTLGNLTEKTLLRMKPSTRKEENRTCGSLQKNNSVCADQAFYDQESFGDFHQTHTGQQLSLVKKV